MGHDKSPFAQLMIESSTGLDMDKDGWVLATKPSLSSVESDGVLIKEIGGQGSDLGEMAYPCGVSVIRNEVYI